MKGFKHCCSVLLAAVSTVLLGAGWGPAAANAVDSPLPAGTITLRDQPARDSQNRQLFLVSAGGWTSQTGSAFGGNYWRHMPDGGTSAAYAQHNAFGVPVGDYDVYVTWQQDSQSALVSYNIWQQKIDSPRFTNLLSTRRNQTRAPSSFADSKSWGGIAFARLGSISVTHGSWIKIITESGAQHSFTADAIRLVPIPPPLSTGTLYIDKGTVQAPQQIFNESVGNPLLHMKFKAAGQAVTVKSIKVEPLWYDGKPPRQPENSLELKDLSMLRPVKYIGLYRENEIAPFTVLNRENCSATDRLIELFCSPAGSSAILSVPAGRTINIFARPYVGDQYSGDRIGMLLHASGVETNSKKPVLVANDQNGSLTSDPHMEVTNIKVLSIGNSNPAPDGAPIPVQGGIIGRFQFRLATRPEASTPAFDELLFRVDARNVTLEQISIGGDPVVQTYAGPGSDSSFNPPTCQGVITYTKPRYYTGYRYVYHMGGGVEMVYVQNQLIDRGGKPIYSSGCNKIFMPPLTGTFYVRGPSPQLQATGDSLTFDVQVGAKISTQGFEALGGAANASLQVSLIRLGSKYADGQCSRSAHSWCDRSIPGRFGGFHCSGTSNLPSHWIDVPYEEVRSTRYGVPFPAGFQAQPPAAGGACENDLGRYQPYETPYGQFERGGCQGWNCSRAINDATNVTLASVPPGKYTLYSSWEPSPRYTCAVNYQLKDSGRYVLNAFANQSQRPGGPDADGLSWQAIGTAFISAGASVNMNMKIDGNCWCPGKGTFLEYRQCPYYNIGRVRLVPEGAGINDPNTVLVTGELPAGTYVADDTHPGRLIPPPEGSSFTVKSPVSWCPSLSSLCNSKEVMNVYPPDAHYLRLATTVPEPRGVNWDINRVAPGIYDVLMTWPGNPHNQGYDYNLAVQVLAGSDRWQLAPLLQTNVTQLEGASQGAMLGMDRIYWQSIGRIALTAPSAVRIDVAAPLEPGRYPTGQMYSVNAVALMPR